MKTKVTNPALLNKPGKLVKKELNLSVERAIELFGEEPIKQLGQKRLMNREDLSVFRANGKSSEPLRLWFLAVDEPGYFEWVPETQKWEYY